MPARSTLTSYNHGRRHNGHLILPHIHPRRDTELIFNPDGTDILTLPGIKRPKSPCQVECPSQCSINFLLFPQKKGKKI